MATAAATSPNYSNLSEPPACAEDWKRMEMKALSDSCQSETYRSTSSDNGGTKNSDLMSSLEPTVTSLSRPLLCTPWRTKEYSSDLSGLHEEINDFYEYMKPRPSEIRMRVEVIQRVMNIILLRYPYARIEPFGSFVTGLFLPTSDLDLVVYCQPQPSLFAIEEDFKGHDIVMKGSTKVLNNLAVPVIKFTDKATKVRVDISFNQITGLHSVDAIAQFMQIYPYMPKLVLVLKQFLAHRNLHEVFVGGISSYSLILLVVSFLQHHPQQGSTDLSTDLGKLLMEFFELYGRNFNYMKTGICVLNGGSYIAKEEHDIQDFLYIRDPVMSDYCNAAGGCYGMWQVKQAFDNAYSRLSSAVLTRETPAPRRESLLGAVVKVSKSIDEYRNWTESRWPSHPLSPPAPIYYAAPMSVPPLHPFHQVHLHVQQYPLPALNSDLDSSHHMPTSSSPTQSSNVPSTSTVVSNGKS